MVGALFGRLSVRNGPALPAPNVDVHGLHGNVGSMFVDRPKARGGRAGESKCRAFGRGRPPYLFTCSVGKYAGAIAAAAGAMFGSRVLSGTRPTG